MDHARYLQAIQTHSDAMRAAAVAAGPDEPIPNCPKWTMHRLVRHIGRVHSRVAGAVADPSGETQAGTPPEEWEPLLAWWDEQRAAMHAALAVGPDAPAYLPFGRYPQTTGSWARRQAHEAAIHRVDTVGPAIGKGGPSMVTFEPEFAADGVDELLCVLQPAMPDRELTAEGTVLVLATDTGHAWALRLEPGAVPQPVPRPPAEPELTVSGTADQLYRMVWGRPHRTGVAGDAALLEGMRAP